MIILTLLILFPNLEIIKNNEPTHWAYLMGAELLLLDTPVFSVLYWCIGRIVMGL